MIIKTLKDGQVFGAELIEGGNLRYTLGEKTGLTGSAPIALPAKQGDLTHVVKLWTVKNNIGLTMAEESALAQLIRQGDAMAKAAHAKYDANPNKYRRFESAADRRDRAYAARYDSQEG